MNLRYPFHIGGTGRTATVNDISGDESHVRDLIAQVLFTAPGERVMRPDFGSGVLALTFEPNSLELAATTQFLVQGALQQWLGHLIAVDTVEVSSVDGTLEVMVRYTMLRSRKQRTDRFTSPESGVPA